MTGMLSGTLLLIVSFAVASHGAPGIVTTEHFNYSLALDSHDNYFLFWKYNATHVTFEVHVKTRGYVGFGLSPNGNMYPADVVVGWVKDGKTYFKDRHTTGHGPPIEDASQDWFLLHGEENDFGTVLKFVRKIDTCDDDDIAVIDGTQRLIFSYHPDDPVDEASLTYHGGDRRGTKSVSLLNQNQPPETVGVGDVRVYDFQANNYVIPDKDTTYLCTGFQMPDIGGKHHMIEYEPIYTPGNEAFVHHLVIQRCAGNHPELHGKTGECFFSWPKGWPQCPEIFIAWATGGGPYYFPSHAGYSVGAPDDFGFYVMQIHYDNPMHKSGVIDNSGIRMRLTSTLRQHDVGTINLGHQVTPFHVIPPHEPAFLTKGYCAEQCLSKGMTEYGVNEITLLAAMQHGHLLATGIKTRHFRNGTELQPIQDDPSYDFYFQEMRTLKNEVTVKKGDSISVECTYNTMGRSEPSFGGLSTREEMCITFIYHYPRLNMVSCDSYPDLTQWTNGTTWPIGRDVIRSMLTGAIDWTNRNETAYFEQTIDGATISHECTQRNDNSYANEVYKYVEQKADYIPHVPPKPACGT